MAKRLQEQLSSAYFQAANKMTSKRMPRRIVAYVESYDDIYFWRTVLAGFENSDRYFEVMLPSQQGRLERGKKAALMSLLAEKVGESLIACVDADYDYFLQGVTPLSSAILDNPYVFHTYAYSIENLQCYAPGLHEVCVAVTLNDRSVFDFIGFLSRFSEIIFPLFVWNIWHYRTGRHSEFTLTDFNRAIELGRFPLHQSKDTLSHLAHKVERKLQQLKRRHPTAESTYSEVEADLRRLGLTPSTTYLYIQGHHLFDTVVLPLLTKVCDCLVRDRETEIRRLSVHDTQMRNELSSYSHCLTDIIPMLKKNRVYTDSKPFRQICKDVQRFLDKSAQTNPSFMSCGHPSGNKEVENTLI